MILKSNTSMTTRALALILAVAGIAALGATGSLAEPLVYLDDLEEAKIAAGKSDQLILVEFRAEGDAMCEAIEADLEANEVIRELLAPLVLVQQDALVGKSKAMARYHEVQAVPTFTLYHPTDGPLHQWKGAGIKGFVRNLQLALEEPTPILTRVEDFKTTPTARDAELLGFFKVSTGKFGQAIPYFEEAERLDTQRQCHAEIFDASYNGFAQKQITVDQLCDAADRVLAVEHEGRELLSLGAIMVYLTEEGREPARCTPYVREALDTTKDTKKEEELTVRRRLQPAYTLYVSEDQDLALEQKIAGLPVAWESSASELNNLAWWCAVHGIHLEKAEEWVSQAVDLIPVTEGPRRASIIDTWAEVAWNRGNRSQAVELLEQALELDPDNTTLSDRLTSYQSQMGDG